MDWILDNLQIVILLALAFASWLKMRLDKKNEEGENPPVDPTVWEDEEEDWPAPPPLHRHDPGNAPPPLVQVRPAIPSPPPLPKFVDAPQASAVLEQQKKIAEEFRRIRQAKQAPPMPVAKKARPAAMARVSSTPLRAALRDRSAVRRAVVLREILDRPVGLR